MIHFKKVKKVKNFPISKNFPSKGGGGGSENLGTFPKFYHVINYDSFP